MDGMVEKIIFAAPGRVEHPENAQQRRLPRARRSHDRQKLSFADFQVDAAQNLTPADADGIVALDVD